MEHVGQKISIFGFDIAYYGMIIGIGILAGVLMAVKEAKRTKQNPETYYDLALYAVIFSIIGARLYYVAFSWDLYKDDLLSILNLREGGLAIYGGVIAAMITVFVFSRRSKDFFWIACGYGRTWADIGTDYRQMGEFFSTERRSDEYTEQCCLPCSFL